MRKLTESEFNCIRNGIAHLKPAIVKSGKIAKIIEHGNIISELDRKYKKYSFISSFDLQTVKQAFDRFSTVILFSGNFKLIFLFQAVTKMIDSLVGEPEED